MRSEPVFGEDCRFFLDARRRPDRRCLHPQARYWVDTSVERAQRWRTPAQRNGANDCRDFRPWRGWERVRFHLDPALLLAVGFLTLVLVCVLSLKGRL